jgi:hypothetical protein
MDARWRLGWLVCALAACSGGGANGPDAGPAATGTGLTLELPLDVPAGVPFPMIVRTTDHAPLDGDARVTAGTQAPLVAVLHRGRGSVSTVIMTTGEVTVTASLGDRTGTRRLTVSARPRRELAGDLGGDDLSWTAERDVVLGADVVVPAGATLVIGAGTRVLGQARANLRVVGRVQVNGTADAPVLFTRAGSAPWGGLDLQPGATAQVAHALFTAGGGDERQVFGHSQSQPVLMVRQATLTMDGGGVIDNAGKGPSSDRATLTLRDVVVSRCDTGGEHNDSALMIERSHYLEIPDGSGGMNDDDNDGIYISSGAPGVEGTHEAIVRDTVFAVTQDDGVDHAGVPVTLERVWIERVHDEGVAASNGSRITVIDSVVTKCPQAIEAGWGGPTVIVEHSALFGNGIGLRWGDEYSTPNTGTVTARYTAVGSSPMGTVVNRWDGGGGAAKPDAFDISCSMVAAPEWDGRAGNAAGTPTFDADGCVTGPMRALQGCPDGAIGPRSCPAR